MFATLPHPVTLTDILATSTQSVICSGTSGCAAKVKRVGPIFCHYCQFENSLTLQILGPATGFEFAIPLGGVNRYGSEFAKEWLPFRGGSHSPVARGIVRVIVRELGTRQSKTGRNPFALFSDFVLSAAVVPCSARNPPTNQKVGSSSPPGRTIFLNETCASVLRQMADHLHENSAARYDDLDGPLTNLMQNFTAAGLTPVALAKAEGVTELSRQIREQLTELAEEVMSTLIRVRPQKKILSRE
jgi:hypothetical protein